MVFNVGVDVSKEALQVHLVRLDAQQATHTVAARTFENRPSAFPAVEKWINTYTAHASIPVRVLMEASGVYHERMAMYLLDAGWYVSVILPTKARRYAQSQGYLSKTDRIDAEGLARMGAHHRLPKWEGISPFWRTLRSLTRQKQRVDEMLTQVRNQAHTQGWSLSEDPLVQDHREALLHQLQQQKAELVQAIETHLQSRSAIWAQVENLNAIKGLAVQSIAVLLAETAGFATFTNPAQLVSYSGYDVVENQSGPRHGQTRISKHGNSHIRRALHFPAFNVVRFKVPVFAQLWQRIYDRTKIPMKGYVAVQKKLLVICYHLWKNNTPFDPDHYHHHRQSMRKASKKVAPAIR